MFYLRKRGRHNLVNYCSAVENKKVSPKQNQNIPIYFLHRRPLLRQIWVYLNVSKRFDVFCLLAIFAIRNQAISLLVSETH